MRHLHRLLLLLFAAALALDATHAQASHSYYTPYTHIAPYAHGGLYAHDGSSAHDARRSPAGFALFPRLLPPTASSEEPHTHIFGGVAADDSYVCSLAYIHTGSTFCSGVLIEQDCVLTAAHCFNGGKKLADIRVRVGDRKRGASRPVPIASIHMLRRWTGRLRGGFDVALVRLADRLPARCVVFPQYVAAPQPADGDAAVALGYGLAAAGGAATPELREARLRIAEDGATLAKDPDCGRQRVASRAGAAPEAAAAPESQILCAVSPGFPAENGGATCGGDSGGPLIVARDGLRWVVGLNSFSTTKCSKTGNVDKFARVYANRDAIYGLVYHGDESQWKRVE